MAFNLEPFPQRDADTPYTWYSWFDKVRNILQQSNQTSTNTPTTGTHFVGEFVQNDTPLELGLIGYKFIIFGWVCITSGSPGTWKEVRTLTGK